MNDEIDELNKPYDESMNFSQVLDYMKDGRCFKLPKWSDDVYISIKEPDEYSEMTAPYLFVTSRFGMVPWIPTMIEVMSTEWIETR